MQSCLATQCQFFHRVDQVHLAQEVFARNLLYHVGGNNFDFKKGDTSRVFGGLTYVYENAVGLLLEGDELNKRREYRINYAFRYFVTPVFTVDLGARNVPRRPGSSARETERIVRLGYTGSF